MTAGWPSAPDCRPWLRSVPPTRWCYWGIGGWSPPKMPAPGRRCGHGPRESWRSCPCRASARPRHARSLVRGTKACSNAPSPKPEYLARTPTSSGVALRPSLPNCLSTRRPSMLAFHRLGRCLGIFAGGRVCHSPCPVVAVEQMHPRGPGPRLFVEGALVDH